MQDALPRDAHPPARAPTTTAPAYVRHRPKDTVLYAVVEEHAEAFFARLGEQGASLLPAPIGGALRARQQPARSRARSVSPAAARVSANAPAPRYRVPAELGMISPSQGTGPTW